MAKGRNQQKKEDLDDEFDMIKAHHSGGIDVSKYMVDSDEDMPGFGELEIYDYTKDIAKSQETGKKILTELVDLYLGDNPEIRNHPYIKSRMSEDAEYYSQMKIMQKLSEKLLLQQMRQIDAGDVAPRMYEIASKHMGEIRENIKDGRRARLEIEEIYKSMRKDLGLSETVNSKKTDSSSDDIDSDDGIIIDTAQLNSKIDDYLKNKDSK